MKTKLTTSAILLLSICSITFSQELNGPTSWDVYENVFSQPNVHMQIGKNKLEWYGSGDVNNDEVIDNNDLDAMNNGVKNDMGDVDGDGISSTTNDKKILEDYLNGTSSYLPGHWNSLTTREERVDWLEKMFTIDDKTLLDYVNNSGELWWCRNYQKQRGIDFNGISNIDEYISWQKSLGEVEYDKTYNARFNIPLQYFSTINTSGDFHAVTGVLVGDDPLNFNDWDFVATDIRGHRKTYPGEFAMSGDGYAEMKNNAYVESSLTGNRYFTFNENLLKYNLTNGEPSLDSYQNGRRMLLHNPNIIKVDVTGADDVNVNYVSNVNTSPSVTGEANVNVKNSPLERVFEEPKPVPQQNDPHKVYVTKEYVDGEHYDSNPTYSNIEYSFDRIWTGYAYSGGVTKNGNRVQKITVKDLENPHGVVPADINLTKEQVENNGGLSTAITGEMTGVGDNSNLAVDVDVNYQFVSENSDKQVYNTFFTLTDAFGNDTTYSPQKVNVLYASIVIQDIEDILVNAQREQDLTPEGLTSLGYIAEPQITVANSTSSYTINYSDTDTIYHSNDYPWADREFTRTFIAELTSGDKSDTTTCKIIVKDLENSSVELLEAVTITKTDSLEPSITGYPEITDNVAVAETVFSYELVSETIEERNYKALVSVTDVFGNDTTVHYQDVKVDLVTGISDQSALPTEYELSQNYPNPFNPTTTIQYSVPNVTQTFLSASPSNSQNQNISQTGKSVVRTAKVLINVYNLLGKKVATLVNESKSAGRYSVSFNANNLPSGIYYYQLKAGDFCSVKKMILLK